LAIEFENSKVLTHGQIKDKLEINSSAPHLTTRSRNKKSSDE